MLLGFAAAAAFELEGFVVAEAETRLFDFGGEGAFFEAVALEAVVDLTVDRGVGCAFFVDLEAAEAAGLFAELAPSTDCFEVTLADDDFFGAAAAGAVDLDLDAASFDGAFFVVVVVALVAGLRAVLVAVVVDVEGARGFLVDEAAAFFLGATGAAAF